MWMNEYEVDEAVDRFHRTGTPNLLAAAQALQALVDWTNENSDGWPYWQKPARAARRLMELLQSVDRWEPQDVLAADVRAAVKPIRAFLTRQGASATEVLGEVV